MYWSKTEPIHAERGSCDEKNQRIIDPHRGTAGEQLAIRFVEIISDSRCPTGAQCIWSGEVSGMIEIDYQDQKKNMVLKQTGSSDASDQFIDFALSFAIEPYPEADKQIKAEYYRLQLTISREP